MRKSGLEDKSYHRLLEDKDSGVNAETTDQVEGRVNAGLPNDVLEGYIDAADADIRRLIVGPLDNFHFSGVVVHATLVRHLNFLRYFETPVRPGGSLKIQDGLTIGGLAYEGSPDFTLTLNATDDSTVPMSMRFPDDGTYRRKESIYVVNGELYAEIPARFMFDSQADYAKWYVPDDARPAITSIEAGGTYEFAIAASGATPLLPTYRSILVDLVRLAVEYDGLEEEEVGGRAGYRSVRRDYHMERSKVLNRLMLTQGRAGVLS